jgi:glycosyltransferase involved in cell wall biosynthesis
MELGVDVRPFSIVIPVHTETELIEGCLRSCCQLDPSEVVVCLDNPPQDGVVEEISRVSRYLGIQERVRVILVDRNLEYAFHQAWVRRQGFRAAKHDLILTVDIDNVVNKNVLQAVRLAGREDIGFVSCLTRHTWRGPLGLWRLIGFTISNRLVGPAMTGLYALWRPFWLETEDLMSIKRLGNARIAPGQSALIGEDAHLCESMRNRYRCIFLDVYGARCVRDDCNDLPSVQFETGRVYAKKMGFFKMMAISFLFARFRIPLGYFSERFGGLRKARSRSWY